MSGFNLADSFIVIGVAILALTMLRHVRPLGEARAVIVSSYSSAPKVSAPNGISSAIANIVSAIHPDLVVLGGGVAAMGYDFLQSQADRMPFAIGLEKFTKEDHPRSDMPRS